MTRGRKSYRVELYRDRAGEYRWRIRAGNGRKVGDSGEGYRQKGAAKVAAERFASRIASAPIVDLTRTAETTGKAKAAKRKAPAKRKRARAVRRGYT